jgi:hypothetical protein
VGQTSTDLFKRIKTALILKDQLDNKLTPTQVKIIGEGLQLEGMFNQGTLTEEKALNG